MWENETVVLVTSLKKRILGGKKSAQYTQISKDDAIPSFIKQIFLDQIEEFITQESPISLHSTPHFDLNSDNLKSLQNQFLETFRNSASFNENEVEKILQEALVLRLNYLIKPIDTIKKVFFGKKEEVDVSDMELKLVSFKKLLPYAEQIVERFQKSGNRAIDSKEFDLSCNVLLDEMMAKEPLKIVLHDFSVLTEFLSETKGEEVTKVEGSVLQTFLTDRNLNYFKKAIDVEIKLGKEDFNSVDLELTLRRYLQLQDEFSTKSIQKEEPVIEKSVKEVGGHKYVWIKYTNVSSFCLTVTCLKCFCVTVFPLFPCLLDNFHTVSFGGVSCVVCASVSD